MMLPLHLNQISKERLVDVVTIFQSIQSIQIDIFSEYLSDFDMYENMRWDYIRVFILYFEEDYEDFAKENIHFNKPFL
jgi:hypothetical protein